MSEGSYVVKINKFFKSFDFRFLIFLFISTLLWLSMQFSKTNIEVFHIDINYILPDKKIFEHFPDQKIIVRLKSKTWNLLYTNKFEEAINIRLKDQKRQVITEALLYNLVEEVVQSKYQIENIIPSSITIDLEKSASKKVPVKLKGTISIKSGFAAIHKVEIIPDSVRIYGKYEDIEGFYEWYTDKSLPLNIDSDIDKIHDLESKPLLKLLSIEPRQVRIQLEVDQLAEKSYKKKILPNIKDNIYCIPAYANIKLAIPLRDLGKINETDIILELDNYDENSNTSKYKLIIQSLPQNAKLLWIEPDSVAVFKRESNSELN